ncbi:MAG: glutamate-cysteine ligase family protein [Gemmatimonadota bacterium]|jgi:gamma-glutamyl:cysteine ligase YbdK (ATP-grasp superfamily)
MTDEATKPTTTLPPQERPGLFDAYGVEIEMMIVDDRTLDVKPVCDRLIGAVAGEPVSEIEVGDIAWSNELTLHVLELKTNGPAPALRGLASRFHENALRANRALEDLGARLMPGAMHPWMDPAAETRLWPHEYTDVYHAFDRIFGCSGHGWANLQSTHLNLPFANDEEFQRLHAAIRIVLPLIPALAASSPFQDGGAGPTLDGRLMAYRGNARRVPSVAGRVVPEPVTSRDQYERDILQRIYTDLEPYDPDGTLRHEWVNARGAIARFDRGTVEIRVIDAQECPTADLAVVAAVSSLVRALAVGPLADRELSADPSTDALADLLDRATVQGERADVVEPEILAVLGVAGNPMPLGRLWARLLDAHAPDDPDGEWTEALETIVRDGPLARRMLSAAGPSPDHAALGRVGRRLCECLVDNRLLPAEDV